jgi:two-component system chemotaxis response regulator CheB
MMQSLQKGGLCMPNEGRDIIVIGTSSGGLEVLDEIISQLPTDLPASIFIVQHLSPESTGEALLQRLGRHKAFQCKLAEHGESFKRGRIYIAPPRLAPAGQEEQTPCD